MLTKNQYCHTLNNKCCGVSKFVQRVKVRLNHFEGFVISVLRVYVFE